MSQGHRAIWQSPDLNPDLLRFSAPALGMALHTAAER